MLRAAVAVWLQLFGGGGKSMVQVGRKDFGRSLRRLARTLEVLSGLQIPLGSASGRTGINVYRF